MFKKILVFYLLVCVFMCKETYASIKRDKNMEIKSLQKKAEKRKYKRRMYFFLGNFYIATGLLNFNNINWEYIFTKKWDLELGLYWGIANLGLGLRINDSLLIRIIGLNILEFIPIFYVCFLFDINDKNDEKQKKEEKEQYESEDDEENNVKLLVIEEEIYVANRTRKPISYIKAPFFSLFNFLSIEIKIAEYWRFNINFTQTILILLQEL